MNSTYRNWIPLVLGVSILVFLQSCSTSVDRPDPFAPDSLSADQEGWGVTLSIVDAGLRQLELKAEYMARFESPDSAYAELGFMPDSGSVGRQVEIQIFDDQGQTSAITKADFIRYNEDRIRFYARGRVTVTAPGGRKMECGELYWDKESRKINAPGFVRVTTNDEQIQGYDLEATENLSSYRIFRITGQVTIDDDF